jgi:hypothetical protein
MNETIAFLHSKYGQKLAVMAVWMLVLMIATPAMAAMRRIVHHSVHSSSHASAKPALGAGGNSHGVSRSHRHGSSYNPRAKRISGHAVLPSGPQSNRVEEIQSALAQQGFYQGEPSGRWDDGTSAAMRQFQQRSGINATGKLDAGSLQRLGLGSDVAGLNPPKPLVQAVPSSNSAANNLPKPPGD